MMAVVNKWKGECTKKNSMNYFFSKMNYIKKYEEQFGELSLTAKMCIEWLMIFE